MVDLDEPGFEVLVQHDVKAQDLETQLILDVLRLAGSVNVPHAGLPSDESLNDQVIDLRFESINIMTVARKLLVNLIQ